ncbi:MAG: hypothetical protein WCV90_05485 [Candidatus Woesearchaeota archaeon]|jgi:hypothetical protein
MLTVLPGGTNRTSLDQEISNYRDKLDQAKSNIDVCYGFIKSKRYELSPTWKEEITHYPRTEQKVLEIEEIIQDFYMREEGEEFASEEFQLARWAIVMGLSTYLRARTIELVIHKAKRGEIDKMVSLISEEETARLFDNTLQSCYPDPNDFVVEYKQFREWHYKGDELERNSFSFWTDLLNHHSRIGAYLEVLQRRKEDLEISGISFIEKKKTSSIYRKRIK